MPSKLRKLLILLNIVSVLAICAIIVYGFLYVLPAEGSGKISSEKTFYNFVGYVLFPCIIYLAIYRLFLSSKSPKPTQESSEQVNMDKDKKRKQLTALATVAVIIGLFLYYYIDITNPTIREWQKDTNVLVISYQQRGNSAGGPYDKRIIISDKKEIDEWLDLIVTKTRYELLKLPCNCIGNPWLKLYESDRLIAEIAIHMGSGISSEKLGWGNFSILSENINPLGKKCAEIGIDYYAKRYPEIKQTNLPDLSLSTETKKGKYSTSKITYRGGRKIVKEVVSKYKDRNVHSRSFYLKGQLKFIEADEDKDGFFETITLLPDDMNLREVEVFIRDKDGTIKPLPIQEKEAMQQKMNDGMEKFNKVWESATDDQKADKISSTNYMPIEIRRVNGQLTYAGRTIEKLKKEIPKDLLKDRLIKILPEPSIKLYDLYPLFNVLSHAGSKRVFVKIYRKDGKEIRSKSFQIDFEDWSQSPEGKVYRIEDGFFKDLK